MELFFLQKYIGYGFSFFFFFYKHANELSMFCFSSTVTKQKNFFLKHHVHLKNLKKKLILCFSYLFLINQICFSIQCLSEYVNIFYFPFSEKNEKNIKKNLCKESLRLFFLNPNLISINLKRMTLTSSLGCQNSHLPKIIMIMALKKRGLQQTRLMAFDFELPWASIFGISGFLNALRRFI